MAHRLLIPPNRRMEGKIHLPMVQDIGGANTRRWYGSLRGREDFRIVRTRPNVSRAPLPALQVFVMSGPGQPNTPESMNSGLRKSNARRLVDKTRGQSAGP
jgi:hypothetical protein